MRKVILMMLLAFVSSSAKAEWLAVGATENTNLTMYTDPITIRKSGNMVKMWGLHDYKTAQEISGKQYMSSKNQSEYDCKEEQFRILVAYFHSGNMGGGEVVDYIYPEIGKWAPVPPGSAAEYLWKIACGKLSVSLDNIKKQQMARSQWYKWQADMKADFDKISALNAAPDLQMIAWDQFLSDYAQDNPYSAEDEKLRTLAELGKTSMANEVLRAHTKRNK